MGAYIQWGGNFIFFDVITSESHSKSATITEHPVESGADVADHVRIALDEVTLEGFISNNPIANGSTKPNNLGTLTSSSATLGYEEDALAQLPIPAVAGLVSSAFGPLTKVKREFSVVVLSPANPQDFVSNTMEILDGLRTNAVIVSVYCPNVTYESMLIQSIHMTRDSSTGNGANFSVSLKQIRIVESSSTSAPVPSVQTPRPIVSKSKGQQQEQPVPQEKQQTFALKLLGLFKSTP